MKKLKVALVTMFALSCSLFLFACGGGNEEEATLKSISVSGGTTEYYDVWANTDEAKHTAFSLGDLVVTGKYDTEDEEKATQVLTSDQYEVDAADLKAAYESAKAGSTIYTVTVSADSGKKTVEATYTATISHQYENGQCVNCGAKNETITINDSMSFPDWTATDAMTLTKGVADSPATVVDDRWVQYGVIDKGQVYTLYGTNTPTASEGWDTPMFAIAANGTGLAIRTDNYIIHSGNPGGKSLYSTPFTDGSASSGTADASSEDWVVYYGGSTLVTSHVPSKDDPDYPNYHTYDFVYTVSYDENSIITINYTMTYEGTVVGDATYTMKVPANVYDVLFFGEECETTVTELSITKEFEMTNLQQKGTLKKTVYAENTYFDRTGLQLIASYSKGGDSEITAYAIYGETADGVATLLTNGSTLVNPVTAEMTKFYISFGGKEIDLGTITVVPSSLKGATTSFDLTHNGVQFENGNASYDYDVNTSGKIALIGSGTADRLTAEQKTALGTSNDYYVAFHIYGDDSETLAKVECSNDSAVYWLKDNGVNVIVPVGTSGPSSFTITVSSDVTASTVVNVDLSAVKVPAVSGVVVSNDSTLDKGGNVEVWYYGYTSSTIDNVTVYNITGAKYSELTADGGYTFKASGVKASAKFDESTNILKVTYQLPALLTATVSNPNLSVEFRVYGAGGSATSPDVLTSLTYNLKVSETLADGWYKVSDTEYLVAAESAGTTTLSVVVLEDSRQLKGTVKDLLLNVGGTATGLPYDLSFSVESDGKDAAKAVYTFEEDNALTKAAQTTIGIVGSINDDTDGDYGAVYMVKLNVTSLFGLSMANGFYAEVVDTTRAENNKVYNLAYFKTNSSNALEIDVNENTSVTEKTIEGSCVTDTCRYYVYDTFAFGYAVTVPATGAHTWVQDDNSTTTWTCKVCNYTRTLVDNSYYVILEKSATDVEGAPGDGWWSTDNQIGTTTVSGNFVLVYTWNQPNDPNYLSDGAIALGLADGSSDNELRKRFIEAATNESWASLDKVTDSVLFTEDMTFTYKILHNGTAAEYPDNSFDSDNAPWDGDYKVTIIRRDGTLTVLEELTTKKNDVWTSELVIKGVTMDDLSVCLWGNPYYCSNIKKQLGEAQTIIGEETIGTTKYTVALQAAQDVENTAEDGWWGVSNKIGGTSVSGDFVLQYTWNQDKDPNYLCDGAIALGLADGSSDNELRKRFIEVATNENWVALGSITDSILFTEDMTSTYTIWNNGTVVDFPSNSFDSENAPWNGDYEVTIIRVGSTLIVNESLTTKADDVWTSKLIVSGFTTEDLAITLWGNPYYLNNVTMASGFVTPPTVE